MNFKYLMMTAVLAIGLASCSNDDDNVGGGTTPGDGQKTVAKISLTQNTTLSTYAPTGQEAPIPAEKEIHSAVLYIFNSSRVLEAEVTLDLTSAAPAAGAEKVFELTAGDKYFYAAVNIPAGKKPVIANGTAMNTAIKSILSVDDVTELYPAASGFFMTNVSAPSATNIVVATQAQAEAGTHNNITIPVGRAMIKASMNYTKANVPQPASGELDDVKFLLANNPKKMHYMPFVNTAGQLESPFFNDPTVTVSNYYPTLGATTAGLTFLSADGTTTTYGMENSNKEVKKGNATFALLQGTFKPATVVDKNGANPTTITSGTTFWRILKDDDTYMSNFYFENPSGGDEMIAAGVGATIAEYTNGLCYYSFYLADNQISGQTVAKYTIRRNSFWKMTITDVGGPGTNTPGGVITNPEEPIEAETYIKGRIEVLDWSVYEQGGGI